MRVVLLDLLVQVLWESSSHHPNLVLTRGGKSLSPPQRRRRSSFSSPRCSPSTLEKEKQEPPPDVLTASTSPLHSDKTVSQIYSYDRRLSTGWDSRSYKLSEAQKTHPGSSGESSSQGREKLPKGGSTDLHAGASNPPASPTPDWQQPTKATSLPRGGGEEKRRDESSALSAEEKKRADTETGVVTSPEPKELLINYVLAKLEGSSERIQKQLW